MPGQAAEQTLSTPELTKWINDFLMHHSAETQRLQEQQANLAKQLAEAQQEWRQRRGRPAVPKTPPPEGHPAWTGSANDSANATPMEDGIAPEELASPLTPANHELPGQAHGNKTNNSKANDTKGEVKIKVEPDILPTVLQHKLAAEAAAAAQHELECAEAAERAKAWAEQAEAAQAAATAAAEAAAHLLQAAEAGETIFACT